MGARALPIGARTPHVGARAALVGPRRAFVGARPARVDARASMQACMNIHHISKENRREITIDLGVISRAFDRSWAVFVRLGWSKTDLWRRIFESMELVITLRNLAGED